MEKSANQDHIIMYKVVMAFSTCKLKMHDTYVCPHFAFLTHKG